MQIFSFKNHKCKFLYPNLGVFSIIFGAAGVIINDWEKVASRGFFDGYTAVVWLVIMLQVTILDSAFYTLYQLF